MSNLSRLTLELNEETIMSDESEKQKESEDICQRIKNLGTAQHLSDEDKLSFAQKALQILQGSEEKTGQSTC